MKLTDLRKFAEIVEAGGLTQAAHRLGVTQPALSRTMRDLEIRMQARLLRRTGRGIELTPAGEAFLLFAQETLAGFEAAKRAVAQAADAPPKRLSLAMPLRIGRLLATELHRAVAERLPETTLHVFEESSDRSAELLAQQQVDVAIVYATPSLPWPEAEPLYAEALYAVGAPALLGAGDPPLSLAALAKLPLLIPSRGGYRALVDDVFAQQGAAPIIARELESADALLAFALEREGIAILPYSNVYHECARGEVVARPIVDPEIARLLALQPGAGLGGAALALVAAAVKAAMAPVAPIARWRPPPRSVRRKSFT